MIISNLKRTGARRAVVVAVLLLCGCAPPFSRAALDRVDRTITFKDLHSDPERYTGKWVMLGGSIIGVRNAKDGTFIEVLQRPLGGRGRPKDTDDTEGRFIISSARFLDAAVYRAGRLITVVGKVAGVKAEPLGEIEYRYPVVAAEELRLWEPNSGPRFTFGVGVGIYHGY
jgi:outer membrane lipoprotein